MSTSWIESHTNLPDHPKTRRAARALDIEIPHMVGLLHCLWYWVTDYAPDGNLTGFTADDIADGARWSGDPHELIGVLTDCGPADRHGFLEQHDDGRLVVHNWAQRGGKLAAQLAEARELGAEGNHVRWHVKRGIVSPDCEFCTGNTSGPESGGHRGATRPESGGQSGRPDHDPSYQQATTVREGDEHAPSHHRGESGGESGPDRGANRNRTGEDRTGENNPPPNPPPQPDTPNTIDPHRQEEGGPTTDRQIKSQVATTLDRIRHQLPDHIVLNGNRRRLETALHPLIVNGWTPDQIAKELTAQQLDDVGNTYAVLTHRAQALHDQPSPASIRQRAERRWRDTVHMLDTRFDPKNEPEDDRPQGATG